MNGMRVSGIKIVESGDAMKRKEFNLGLDAFKKILYMEQHELHFYTLGKLEQYFSEDDIFAMHGEYIYARGNIPVLLCAHFDTVHTKKPTKYTLFHDQEKQVMWCPDGIGGDDRCGVFNILDILSQGYLPHVIFSWDEEIGGVGATKFSDNVQKYFGESVYQTLTNDINFAIQFDRKGFSEAVYYYLDNKPFEEYINSFGFTTELGSYTDICEYCPAFGFAGVNISAGYLNEHTSSEMIFLKEMLSSQDKVIKILEDQIQAPERFDYKEFDGYWKWGGQGSLGYSGPSRNTYNFDDIAYGYDGVYEDSEVGDPYGPYSYASTEKEYAKNKTCQYCMQSRGVVPWTPSDDPVLDTLCDECKEVFKSENNL